MNHNTISLLTILPQRAIFQYAETTDSFWYLISMGVPANDDGLDPARYQAGDVLADDGLPEHCASEDVTDGAVGRTPHLLQLELFHAILIWRDGGALDAHVVALDCLRRLNRHPVVCCISVLHTEVIALQEETETIV